MSQKLAPIAAAWREKITRGIEKRKPWLQNAKQCELFYAAAPGWMWSDEYRSKFKLDDVKPKFHMTVAKAFEFVALYGPSLYWKNPIRTCKPKERLEIVPEDLMFLGVNDLNTVNMIGQQMQTERRRLELTSKLTSLWLNYTPNEQVGGGLKAHSKLATIDALVKGRGCLTVEPYQYPGSDRKLTGAFYMSPYDLVIDPDADTIWNASWMAIRCVHPVWQFVQKYAQYGVTEEIAKRYANHSTNNGVAENSRAREDDGLRKTLGESYDCIVYWKIYSKGGLGARLANNLDANPELKQLDTAIGDYPFLIIPDQTPDIVFNCPNEVFNQATPPNPEDLAGRFAWPIPYWKDGKWPVDILDFNPVPGSVWPIAPLTPGMGELMFMNIIMSFLPTRIVSSSRDFIQCPKALEESVNDVFSKGLDLSVFGIPTEFASSPQGVISFLQHPPLNTDLWTILDRVALAFDKRVGLSELMYGYNPGATSRTAEDAAMKREALSVRPDDMATSVEEWQTEVAKKENICTQLFIGANDVKPVIGEVGSLLWGQLIMARPIEDVLRETDVSIEAGSARKPNKDRDVANAAQALQYFLPVLMQYSMQSGDVNPVNAIIEQWGDANDMDMTGFLLQPPPPPQIPIDQNGQPIPQGAPMPQQAAPQQPPMPGVAA
jgi:hypothetical protein